MGRSKFAQWLTPDGLQRLEGWARAGLTEEQIAHNIGISRSTFFEWKKQFPSIADAVKNGKEPADQEVENALFRRACGYEYTETRTEAGKTVIMKKQMPPEVAACIFWLRNRRPERWRNNPEAERDGGRPNDLLISLYELMTNGDNLPGGVDDQSSGVIESP
jgi:hypothetical protein